MRQTLERFSMKENGKTPKHFDFKLTYQKGAPTLKAIVQ